MESHVILVGYTDYSPMIMIMILQLWQLLITLLWLRLC